MSKARDIRLHEETMEKLDTLSCQLHSLSSMVRKQSAAAPVTIPAKAASFWEQQCREKDATLTETLRKLQAAEEEMFRQIELAESLHARLDHSLELPTGMIFSQESRAEMNSVVKDYIRRMHQ